MFANNYFFKREAIFKSVMVYRFTILLICVEKTASYEIAEWKAAVVDGETIKADTWYTLKDGEFVEVPEK